MRENVNANIRWKQSMAGEPAVKRRKYLDGDARSNTLRENLMTRLIKSRIFTGHYPQPRVLVYLLFQQS